MRSVTVDALAQAAAGADMLDVNVGIPLVDEPAPLKSMLRTVQEAVDLPICIDSSVIEALEAGLSVYEGRALVNSVTAEDERLEEILPLVAKYGAAVIGLANDETGIRCAPPTCCSAMIRGARAGSPPTVHVKRPRRRQRRPEPSAAAPRGTGARGRRPRGRRHSRPSALPARWRRGPLPSGTPVFDAASWNGIAIDSTCGGYGTCKKCKVRVVSGDVPISSVDPRAFSPEELRDGWRLACRAGAREDLVIEVPPLQTRPKAALAGVGRHVILRPSVRKRHLVLEEPTWRTSARTCSACSTGWTTSSPTPARAAAHARRHAAHVALRRHRGRL